MYNGGSPRNFLIPSVCICTFTKSVGDAKNCPIAPILHKQNNKLHLLTILIQKMFAKQTICQKKNMRTTNIPADIAAQADFHNGKDPSSFRLNTFSLNISYAKYLVPL